MVRENHAEANTKEDERILIAQGNDSSTTGPQWHFDRQNMGSGEYQLGHDLKGNGCITKIERADAQNCTITLENSAKLNFKNDHIVKIERPDGSTFELQHYENGGLKQIKMPSGESYKHKDGRWFDVDGRETDKQFDTNIWGSVGETSRKDSTVGTLHYPDGTSVSGFMVHTLERTTSAITKVERLGEMLAECKHDGEGFLNQISLASGDQWQRQGSMQWKSNTGDVYKGSFYFENGRHLRRKNIEGEEDLYFRPF